MSNNTATATVNAAAPESAEDTRRLEGRDQSAALLFPVSMVVRWRDLKVDAEVINFHHKGACVRFKEVPETLVEHLENNEVAIDFHLGNRRVRSNIPYRLAWQSLAQDRTMGIEFLAPSNDFIPRSPRFGSHPEFPPQITAQDPLDPNRTVYFRIQNLSESGMLLVSSLANKHLLPGLSLQNCHLSIPGQKSIDVTLFIANTRRSDIPGMFEVGASVEGNKAEYIALTRKYVSILAPNEEAEEDPVILTKKLKQGLTYRIVNDAKEYEKVLKLRYAAYGNQGKVKKGASWTDQGEGLDKEGTLLAGYIGNRMICSVELRFSDSGIPFRIAKYFDGGKVPIELSDRTVEINKLSVHPKAQGTDVFVGIFQKMHSILVTKGGYDVLIAATDKLAPLYLRLGFERTKYSAPHPYLPDQRLNMLVLDKHSYLEAKQINPLSWMAVYDSTHRFLESIGVARKLENRPLFRLKRAVGKFFLPLLNRKKRRSDAGTARNRADSRTNGFIDPKWTSQHIIAPIMMPYILEADAMIGVDKVEEILARIGVPRSFLLRHANWVSVAFLDEFLEEFSAHGSIAELSRRSGDRSLQLDQIGVKYYLLKHFVTPQQTFQAAEKILPTFNRTRSYRLLSIGRTGCKVAIGTVAGFPLPRHRESCMNWQANFEAYFKIMTGTIGKVQKLACCYDGNDACVYEMTWAQSRRLLPTFLIGASATVALGLGVLFLPAGVFSSSYSLTFALALAAGSVAAMLREVLQRRNDSKSFTQQFERLEQEGNEKYSELQTAKTSLDERYREARLLEETAKTIQSGVDLPSILNASLAAVCQNFDFDRAFVMLTDERGEKLRTAAVAGVKGEGKTLWSFQVDVSAHRPNGIFVSSVYHTGNPVLIDNIETHFFQFNETSQNLIRALETRGFIVVPIPRERGRWGVLIADKVSPEKNLARTDLTLLQRLAQHLGISLDKQAKLDHERNTRQLFQKYVPPHIVHQVNSGETSVLGGQVRNVASLFFDIRDFTSISDKIAPQVSLDLLNRVFEMVSTVVGSKGGWIDKFLGDGAFITWGAVGEPVEQCTAAVDACVAILEGLKTVNDELEKANLPAIRIGMGLNWGSAIVGNVGSASRMEFTTVGATVNLASRLQSLTKELGSQFVVSESVWNGMEETHRKNFKLVEDVMIRGLDKPVKVGVYGKPTRSRRTK